MLANSPVYAVVPCTDLERARKFYGQTLGLKEVEPPSAGEGGADEAALYECGGGTNLFVYVRPTPTKADHTAAGWVVEDLDSVADELIRRGVKFEVYDMPGVEFDDRGVASMGNLKSAWFTDPEGNILAINQMP
jgi:catechol 2,3-dioxygenase-like lactoylglutathione lyase family enzyme